MYIYNLILLVSFKVIFVQAAKILAVFPTPSISHQVVFRTLTQELARRGHEVVVATPDPAFPKGRAPRNLTEIDLHDLSYDAWRKHVLSGKTTTGKSDDLPNQMRTMVTLSIKIFEEQIQTEEMQKLIRYNSSDFDLLLIEACFRPALSLSHVFKVPVILVSSFSGGMSNFDVMGAPTRPVLLYPTALRQRIYDLSFSEKLFELYNHLYYSYILYSIQEKINILLKRLFGPETPPLHELDSNVQMLFINVHPIWEQNRPMPPNVVYMGGIHQKPSKALPKDLEEYLDSSKNGVVYVSFGTNVSPSSLPPEKIQMLVRVFSQLPYDVLWKWDKEELPGKGDNIKISKWFPQSDMLKHPKIKLFITQGGLQSTDEAITAGVPLLGIPMLGDQWFNVEQYVYHKVGLKMDMETMTDEKLLNAISTITDDERYRQNIKKLRDIMSDQPQAPLDRAVWWTEHVLRHGGAKHLRARAANLTWSEYLDLPFFTKLTLLTLALVSSLFYASYLLFTLLHKYIALGNSKLKSN